MHRKLFIAIEGPIGVGKTTLATTLANKLDYQILKEPLTGYQNSLKILREKFYHDMKRWAFPLQIKLFIERFKQHQKAILERDAKGIIQDRSIYGDKPFAYIQHKFGFISEEEILIYEELWDSYKQFLVYPDLMIFLKANTDVLLERIKKRNRNSEHKITKQYLDELNTYITFLHSDMKRNGVTCWYIDWNEQLEPTTSSYHAKLNDLIAMIKMEEKRHMSPWKHTRFNEITSIQD